MRTQPTALIVDLTRVGFLASVAMTLLIAAHHKITEQHGSASLLTARAPVG